MCVRACVCVCMCVWYIYVYNIYIHIPLHNGVINMIFLAEFFWRNFFEFTGNRTSVFSWYYVSMLPYNTSHRITVTLHVMSSIFLTIPYNTSSIYLTQLRSLIIFFYGEACQISEKEKKAHHLKSRQWFMRPKGRKTLYHPCVEGNFKPTIRDRLLYNHSLNVT